MGPRSRGRPGVILPMQETTRQRSDFTLSDNHHTGGTIASYLEHRLPRICTMFLRSPSVCVQVLTMPRRHEISPVSLPGDAASGNEFLAWINRDVAPMMVVC